MRYIKLAWMLVIILVMGSMAFVISNSRWENKQERIDKPVKEITNPYEEVKWNEFEYHKANLHAHTSKKGGKHKPAQVIDMYRDNNYSILAITDHNRVTWPWEKYNRCPEEQGMTAIQANEISNTHDMGSYFTSLETGSSDENQVLNKIEKKEGLAVLFHPGRYNRKPEWYCDLFKRYPCLVGLEVINRDDRYPADRNKWDKILTRLMPENPVWGFANDDMHKEKHLGTSYNMFILEKSSNDRVKEAMQKGQFYFSRGESPPEIKTIKVDEKNKKITVEAGSYRDIKWLSAGEEITYGKTLDLNRTLPLGAYVRAVVKGDNGKTYTNPFGLYFKGN